MDDDTSTSEERTDGSRLTRRRVLKTAGHAAWAIPAIQVVSMAPAFAALSDPLAFNPAPYGDWTLGATDSMTATITVENNSTTDTATDLLLTVTFPRFYVYKANQGGNQTITVSVDAGAWTAGPVAYTDNNQGNHKSAEVVFSASSQVNHGDNSSLTFTVTTTRDVTPSQAANSNDTVSVQATATGFVGASTTFNPSAP